MSRPPSLTLTASTGPCAALRPRPRYAGRGRWVAPLILLALLPLPAAAQDEARPPRQIGEKRAAPCVVVEVGGYKAGHLDCATQALEEAARTAQAQARASLDASVISATSPDVRTGVANQTATRLRMGNSFGRSVIPQRPGRAGP